MEKLKIVSLKKDEIFQNKLNSKFVINAIAKIASDAFEEKPSDNISYLEDMINKMDYVFVGEIKGKPIVYALIRIKKNIGEGIKVFHFSGFGVIHNIKSSGIGLYFLRKLTDILNIELISFHTQNPIVVEMVSKIFKLEPNLELEDSNNLKISADYLEVWKDEIGDNSYVAVNKYNKNLYKQFPLSRNNTINKNIIKILGKKHSKNAICFLGKASTKKNDM